MLGTAERLRGSNGSDGIKNARKDDKSQLPETREEGNRGAAPPRERETRRVTSAVGLRGFDCVSFAYSVQVPGGGGEGDDADSTQRELKHNPSLSHSACTAAKSYIKSP